MVEGHQGIKSSWLGEATWQAQLFIDIGIVDGLSLPVT